ncbi:MAG: sigma factor-like helix-turn-helix DNA-binding protein [Lachnospiraceae bacterium]|nr:sigma factor-like helix-turn-helix DNA-binding protein [Lachnospiraceae bacterium]
MTNKDKVDYLRNYHWTLENIKLINERLERGDKYTNKEDLERRLSHALKSKDKIESLIHGIKDERLALLLELTYIEDLPLDSVAERMGLSYSRITKLHIKALNELKIS